MILFELDPNVIKPGWTPLIITVVLAIALVFLYRSMRKQFGKISVARRGESTITTSDGDTPDPQP